MFKTLQRFWWIPLPLCLAIIVMSWFRSGVTPTDPRYPATLDFKVSGKLIDLENAATPDQQRSGLMFRDKSSFPDNRGMLFPLRDYQAPYPISMRNVSFPLDYVFMEGTTVTKVIHLDPCGIDCPITKVFDDATFFIVLNGGVASQLDLHIGKKIELSTKK